MTLSAVRSLVTLVSLLLFVALMIWTWWPARRGEHESASQLVFEGERDQADDGATR